MVRQVGWVATLVVAGLMVATDGHAQTQSRCADCHFANPGSVSASHLSEWDLSGHGRANVGCETCHGGDPRSFEPFIAHKDILARTNPASPYTRRICRRPAARATPARSWRSSAASTTSCC